MITVGLKLVRADGSSIRKEGRVVYPVGEWITVHGAGAYVAVTHQADLRCGGDGPLLIAVQCQEPTGADAPPGIACFRRVRRMSEGCASAGPLRAYDAACDKALRVYNAARAEPQRAYDAACVEALRAYDAASANAWRAYDAARANAWRAYDAARAGPLHAYDAARAEALRAYDAARANAWRAYDAARAEAWLALVATASAGAFPREREETRHE